MRARLALALSSHTVMIRELILRDKPAHMLEVSPKGTVPVLILTDGTVIDESRAVMDWAIADGSAKLQAPSLLGQGLIDRNDGQFKRDLDRYKYPSRYEGVDALEHRASGADYVSELDRTLAKTGQLDGDVPGYTDYAIFPFIRQFRIADPGWFDAQDWPHLHPWLADHMGSELFQWVMRKFPLYNETGEEVAFSPFNQ